MKKENLLIILPYWDSTFRNKNVGKLIQRLDILDHQIFLYCSSSSGDSDLLDFIPHITLLNNRPPSKKGFLRRLRSLFIFMNVLRKIKDVKVFWTYAGYIENLVLSFFKIPFVLKSDSSLELVSEKKSFFSKLRAFLFFEYVGKKANLILVETRQLQKKTLNVYPKSKVLYFPNGVNINSFNNFKASYKPSLKSKNFFLCTGRMIHLKGIDLAIKSFALIASKIDWEMHFVGSAEDDNFMNHCSKLINNFNLDDRIFFHDVCFGDDLFKKYEESDIFIMPSRNEGLANRLPEAMIFGNPVIGYDVGYSNELINSKSGALIAEENFEAFGEAMLNLAQNDDLRNKISINNKNLIINNYDDQILFDSLFKKAESCEIF